MSVDIDEFLELIESEPDSYELIDGVLVRLPEHKQDNRRLGLLMRSTEMALGLSASMLWIRAANADLGGRSPFQCVRSWSSLGEALGLLPNATDGTFTEIRERANRLAEIEQSRHDALLSRITDGN